MAKHKKPSRRGRSGDPRKRAAEAAEPGRAEATPELEEEVEAALASGHPIDIVMLASSLIAGLDPDEPTPGHENAELPPPEEFVRMFLDSDDERLQILAWTVSRLLPDARLQAEVAVALAPGRIPHWLAPLDQPEVAAAWQTTDPLHDSSDVVISLRLGGEDLTVIGLIDLNRDGALKDGFAIPAPLSAFQQAFDASGETGMESRELAPADARAWLSEAVAVGRESVLPFISDSWPQARPLLEWAARQCPPGGRGWQRRDWTTDEIEVVVAEFAASPEGALAGDGADRAVLADALTVISGETRSDPMLLSAVRLEIGLGALWLTTLHHEVDQLVALPGMLRAYVRWAHTRRAIPTDDTDEALAVIAHRGAEFVRDVAELLGPEGPEEP